MKKCLIVYFSQGGTTAQIAESIAAGLRTKEYHVDLHNINDGIPHQLEGYSLLGIGLPLYIFRPPLNMNAYVKSLPDLDGLPFFVFFVIRHNPW